MADTDADVVHDVLTDISVLLDKEGFLANQTAAKVDKLKNETDIISISKTIFIDITTITKPR